MSKFTLVTLILFFTFFRCSAFDPTFGKIHPFSFQIVSPLSAASKIGGVVEIRIGGSSFNIGFINYTGAYQGKQYKLEYQKYFKTTHRNEYFWYAKALGGDAKYVSDKLSIIGDKSKTEIGPIDYYAVGAGVGRKFNFNHIAILINAGLKYATLPKELSDENREDFRVFYATGPGSIFDLNCRIGYQF